MRLLTGAARGVSGSARSMVVALRPAVPVLVLALLAPLPVLGQVTLDLDALDALPQSSRPAPTGRLPGVTHRAQPRRQTRAAPKPIEAPPAQAAQAAAPTPTSPPAATREAKAEPPRSASEAPAAVPVARTPPAPTTTTPGQGGAAQTPHAAPMPEVPASPPPVAMIAPVAPPTVSAAAKPPAPSPSPTPVPKAQEGPAGPPLPAPLLVTFQPGKTEPSKEGDVAIAKLAKETRQTDTTTFEVAAYAAGEADDPSSARRLSLARALAIRNALIAAGVPSTHILVRALGPAPRGASSDHADIKVMGSNTASAAPADVQQSKGVQR